MSEGRYYRFDNSHQYFRCPHCLEALWFRERSLVCERGHCFDIAKQGYVNFISNVLKNYTYNKESFVKRKIILDCGYYLHILEAVLEEIGSGCGAILDAGCGEGYFSREVYRAFGSEVLGFDISRDSIRLASQAEEGRVKWFVADLSGVPILDKSVDCVLNVFSPAHYGEFRRVLREGGKVVKVVPSDGHLKELREAARGRLRRGVYSNERVVSYFREHFRVVEQRFVSQWVGLSGEALESFVEMTPMLFGVDRSSLDLRGVKGVSVEASVLIGRF